MHYRSAALTALYLPLPIYGPTPCSFPPSFIQMGTPVFLTDPEAAALERSGTLQVQRKHHLFDMAIAGRLDHTPRRR
jgi:hypothetical protein